MPLDQINYAVGQDSMIDVFDKINDAFDQVDTNTTSIATSSTHTTTTTSNGLSLVTTGGALAPVSTSYYYNYVIVGKLLFLNFTCVVATNASPQTITEIQIPLPTGITKDTGISTNYSPVGFAQYDNPTASTNYCPLAIYGNKDGTEGQRLVLVRSDGSRSILWSVSTTATIKGSITLILA